ncbi:3'-5' exonuclease [Myxococcus llanfairpwllgwyngyllgogerychwyrndrobwllllantysiliogogogochensis]|uniref:3'-5' exonuclease n=1 Tax=Myxococcus llanfairpwllgwyngyllgogerychwyrndrobwllllantysiliogogogochensis TaxID=2590453 RepID=A0A540WSV4_9BACT|nr:3'-5' exonuclease [Myxococcus llanfairpwllgwyngyllgogerychwyrndrobwllllantysiliogogogochensis]TQF12017.1 3'-5' exonuclease [Myxococcus llanfairpwllgwyngyllgogerychwyrndrobwllllantysiliogogogochensis]
MVDRSFITETSRGPTEHEVATSTNGPSGLLLFERPKDVPTDLMSRSALRRAGLEPGPLRGRVRLSSGLVELFRRSEAKPRGAATPAQLAALERANTVRVARAAERDKQRLEHEASRRAQVRIEVAVAMNKARANALSLFKSWASDRQAVVLDVEATDLKGRVVEVAVVDLAGAILLHRRISPGCEIAPEAQAVHGLSLADLAGEPGWESVVDEFEAITSGRPVLAFGAHFDGPTIARTTEVVCGPERGRRARKAAESWLCVQGAAAPLLGAWDPKYNDFKLPSLSAACAFARVDVTTLPRAHSAVGDALRTVALVHAAARLAVDELTADGIPDSWLTYRPRAVERGS